MTTTTIPAQAAPESTKFGFYLHDFKFKKSIEKALALKPAVRYLSAEESMVQTQDLKSEVCVRFFLVNNKLMFCCSCYSAQKAQPCHHLPAAALDRGALSHSLETIRAVSDNDPPESDVDEFLKHQWEIDHGIKAPTDDDLIEMENRFQPVPAGKSKICVECGDLHDRKHTNTCKPCSQNLEYERANARLVKPQPKNTYVKNGWDL